MVNGAYTAVKIIGLLVGKAAKNRGSALDLVTDMKECEEVAELCLQVRASKISTAVALLGEIVADHDPINGCMQYVFMEHG